MTAFLADENFPATSIRLLREAGHDVISIAEVSPALRDEAILNLSIVRDRIVITFDRDFGELIFRRGMPMGGGIIYFRLGQFRPDEPAKLILEEIRAESGKFDGLFSVISRTGLRQRRV